MYTEYTVGIGTIVLFILAGFLSGLLFKVRKWKHQRVISLAFAISEPELKGKIGETQMAEVTLTNEQKVKVSVAGLTEGGKVVPLDTLEVSFQGDGSAEVLDPTSFYAISGLTVGDTTIEVTGTISGVLIPGTFILHTVAANIVGLQINAGTPELK